MHYSKLHFVFLLFIICLSHPLISQVNDVEKKEKELLDQIQKLGNDHKKIIKQYINISVLYFGEDNTREEYYLNKAIGEAEKSRDRLLITETNLDLARQYLSMGGINNRIEKAIYYANKGLKISAENNYNIKTAQLNIVKARAYRANQKFGEALQANEDAVNYAEIANDDTIKILALTSHGVTLIEADKDLQGFKKLMAALGIANDMGRKDDLLLINNHLGSFYIKVDENEKAKDCYTKCVQLAKELKEPTNEFNAYDNLMNIYAKEKQNAIAKDYLTLMSKIADTITANSFLKTRVLFSELNYLFALNEKDAAKYIRDNPKIYNDLYKWGYRGEAYKVKGMMYSIEQKPDSALHYFKLLRQELDKSSNPVSEISYYQVLTMHHRNNGNVKKAIEQTERSHEIAKQNMLVAFQIEAMKTLDTLYKNNGFMQKYLTNKVELSTLEDSINKSQKVNEAVKLEVDLENKRIEKEELLRKVALDKKHNLQYMGITAGLVSIFIFLGTLGYFRVRPTFIRGLGFLSFIILFEFIILIADQKIHHLTHGDPLSILLIKIVLIAVLMPIHHYLENKVISYLLKHRNAGQQEQLGH